MNDLPVDRWKAHAADLQRINRLALTLTYGASIMPLAQLRIAQDEAKKDPELKGRLRQAVIDRYGELIAARSRSRKAKEGAP